MKNFVMQICGGLLLAMASSVALAQTPTGDAVPVTADNFKRAETDMYFAMFAKQGGFGKFEIHTAICRSKTPACGRTATRFIRWPCSILMRGP